MSRYCGVITLCPVLHGVVGVHEDVPGVPAVCPQEWILVISARIASVDGYVGHISPWPRYAGGCLKNMMISLCTHHEQGAIVMLPWRGVVTVA